MDGPVYFPFDQYKYPNGNEVLVAYATIELAIDLPESASTVGTRKPWIDDSDELRFLSVHTVIEKIGGLEPGSVTGAAYDRIL